MPDGRRASTFFAFTATIAGCAPPGYRRWKSSSTFTSGTLFGSASMPLIEVWRLNAGIASAIRIAADAAAAHTGCASTGRSTAFQTRGSPPRRSRPRNGMRPFSTLSPSTDRSAGSTVSEPSIATATTSIVPTANDMNVLSPERNIPAIAMITVMPEISTARPDVAAATSRAASGCRPAARSSRSRLR